MNMVQKRHGPEAPTGYDGASGPCSHMASFLYDRALVGIQLKLYHTKRKPYVNMVQKRHHVLWAKANLKWTVSKWKSVLWSDETKFDILVGNHGCCVLRAKEEGDLPACYQRSVQKPASQMVWGCICARGLLPDPSPTGPEILSGFGSGSG